MLTTGTNWAENCPSVFCAGSYSAGLLFTSNKGSAGLWKWSCSRRFFCGSVEEVFEERRGRAHSKARRAERWEKM